ncbi:glycoside hydrolase family 88 protein [Cystobacter ferrugineus]|uniref:glycoside hydrolase family 88 protein n=1 Tax=Cystobacter ferrugineus TaxID=83449 RepID=UPI001FE5B8A0|nr:glycoside hydrolase family 88 protein [Cystobacter ferrugineus]
MKARHGVYLLLGLCCTLAAGPVQAFDEEAASSALQVARRKLTRTAEEVPLGQYPKSSEPDGTWLLVPADNRVGWTQGFFPGELWLIYDQSREPDWRTLAETWTRPLEVQQYNTETHDLGFKFMPSYGLAYELTNDDYYRQVLLRAAGSLASRYNPRVGIISCCDWNPDWHLPMVSDTMMNLELLLWASRNGGQPGWRDMALNHALRTLADIVRPDGSTYHVVDYDPDTGAQLFRGTFQGYSDTSTWARGHAWVIYGFTMVYRYTRDPRMLEAAQRVTDYYLGRLPEDTVPNWDLDAPIPQKDSSTAAAVASALLELSNYVPDADKKAVYWNAALRMLDALSSPAYLDTEDTSPGILLHAVGHLPAGQEVDVSLIYGDYYFLEAIRRFQRSGIWSSQPGFAAGTRTLGSGNTGVQVAEFDVMPRAQTLDGVIGHADSSARVTSRSEFALSLRLSPAGVFDAYDGTRYAATNAVPYEANAIYHVRILADLPAGRYSVWIKPPSGPEVLLADRFAFRSSAPVTDDLGQLTLKSTAAGEFWVVGHTLRPAPGARPAE